MAEDVVEEIEEEGLQEMEIMVALVEEEIQKDHREEVVADQGTEVADQTKNQIEHQKIKKLADSEEDVEKDKSNKKKPQMRLLLFFDTELFRQLMS